MAAQGEQGLAKPPPQAPTPEMLAVLNDGNKFELFLQVLFLSELSRHGELAQRHCLSHVYAPHSAPAVP